MSTKTFIVSGDSYTVPLMYPETPHSWPTYLAQERGWDLINLAKGGCSNTHIFNSLVDAIEQNKNKDVIVFAFWTEAFRVNFFDLACGILESEETLLRQFELGEYEDAHKKYAEEVVKFSDLVVNLMEKSMPQSISYRIQHAYECAVNFTIRHMWMMDQWCKFHGIEFYHGSALSPFGDDTMIHTLHKRFNMDGLSADEHIKNGVSSIKQKNPYYKYLAESSNYMGFSFDGWYYINSNDLNISKKDHHPNDEGHRRLSQIIGKFIDDNIKININNEQYSRPVYIYD